MPKWLKKSLIIITAIMLAGTWGFIATMLGIHWIIQTIGVALIGGFAMSFIIEKNSN